MTEHVLSSRDKSIPAAFWGRRADDVAAERPPLTGFATPLLTLDRGASDRNVATMIRWVRERGMELAPHGKTTMAPELWQRLLDAGAWGLTLATAWQVQVARAHGIRRILLANELIDPVQLRWLAGELDADAEFEFACWVDSAEAVAAIAATPGSRPVDVLVELGSAGGRTGARGVGAALAVARAAAASPRLRLRGVTGYEGSYGSHRGAEGVARVDDYLAHLVELASTLLDQGLVEAQPLVSAGGSAWFDRVADALAPLRDRATIVLRSGAFQAHDDVFYDGMSPFAGGPLAFAPALTLWSRVVSRPEPTLVLLDAGKRDAPVDLDLPVLLDAAGTVTGLNDQHAYVAVPADSPLAVGDVVRMGISHPCTAFDRWRVVVEVDDATAIEPRVVGFVETFF